MQLFACELQAVAMHCARVIDCEQIRIAVIGSDNQFMMERTRLSVIWIRQFAAVYGSDHDFAGKNLGRNIFDSNVVLDRDIIKFQIAFDDPVCRILD